MRQPVLRDRDNSWVAKQHLIDAPRHQVPLIGGLNVAFEQRSHLWQIGCEPARDLMGLLIALDAARSKSIGRHSQFSEDFFEEQLRSPPQCAPDEVIDAFLAEPLTTETHWGERSR